MKGRIRRGLAFLLSLTMLLGMVTTAHAEEPGQGGSSKLTAGTYTVPVDMRKADDGASSSMAAAVLNKSASLEVAADGTMKLSLNFPKDVQIMNIGVHVTGIDIYGADGSTPVSAELTTYDAKLRDEQGAYTVDGKAVSDAVVSLSGQADDGLYPGKIYSDFMSSDMQIYVDFANAVKQAAPVDRTALDAAIAEAEGKTETEWTAKSWADLQTALANAKAVTADAEQETVDAAKDALLAAISALEAAASDPAPVVPEDAVASITAADGTVTYYTSLADVTAVTDEAGNETSPAVSGAVSSLKGGETLTLLKDTEYAGVKTKSGEAEMTFSFDGGAVLNLNGHTLTGTLNSTMTYLLNVANGSLTVKNGTIQLSTTKGSSLIIGEGASGVIAGDAKISGGRYGVQVQGSLTVNPGATIEATNNYALGVGENCTSVTVDGAVLTCPDNFGLYLSSRSEDAIMTADIKNTAIAGRINVSKNTSVKLENCTVQGKSYGVNVATGGAAVIVSGEYVSDGNYAVQIGNDANVSINGGRFKASYRAVNRAAVYPEGQILSNTADGDGWFTLIPENEYSPIYVAQTGTEKYEDLKDAIVAAKDGETITLLADTVLTSSATLGTAATEASTDENGNVVPAAPISSNTLDLNGHVLNATSYINSKGTLKVTDSSEEKTGVYSSSATYCFYPYGGLILDGITVKYTTGSLFLPSRCADRETGIQILNCTIDSSCGVGGLQYGHTGAMVIKDSVIEGRVYANDYADELIIENTKINASNYAGVSSDAPATLTNCEVYSESAGASAVRIGAVTCTINGGIYKGGAVSLEGEVLQSEFVINGGEFSAAASVTNEDGTTTVTEAPYAVANAGKTIVDGGYFKGTEGAVDGFTQLPEGKKLALNETEGDSHKGWYMLADRTAQDDAVKPEYEAELTLPDGSKKELERVSWLYFYQEEGPCSVKLLKDATLSSTITVKDGTELTFDLNGKSLTADSGVGTVFESSSANGSMKLLDSSEAGTGTLKMQAEGGGYLLSNWMIDTEISGGTYYAGGIAGLVSNAQIRVTGGSFDVQSVLGYAFGGGVSISGGRFKTDAVKNYLVSGAVLGSADADGWYTIEMTELDLVPYPLAYHMYDSELGIDQAAGDGGFVSVDMDGKAWVNISVPSSLGMKSVKSITAPDGSEIALEAVKITGTETTETSPESFVSTISFPMEEVYGKADSGDYSAGKNCYTIKADMGTAAAGDTYYTVFDWSGYEGPAGTSKAYDVSVNHSGTAMSEYNFNTNEVIYVFENGYSFMKVDMDNFFEGMGYERGGSMNTGEMTALSSQKGGYPAYVLTEYETLTSEKFGEFQSIAKVLVSLDADQTEMAVSTEMKIDAMGFSVVLADTLKWETPDTSVTLEELIAQAEALNREDYTEESWAELEKALAAAKAVTENTSEEEIERIKDDLYGAIVKLAVKEAVDWSGLNEAVAKAEALTESDYTAASWEALQTALENAKRLGDDATQAQVDMYLSALEKAMGALVTAGPAPSGAMKPGAYTVAVDLRKETDGSASSMSSVFMNKTAVLTVAADGTMTLSLSFPENQQYAGITAHVLDMVVYGEDGTTEMARTNKTYSTTLTDGTEGTAVNGSDIALTYESETGLYKASLVSDFMGTSGVQLYVDFGTVEREGGEEPEPEKADKTRLAEVISKAEALTETAYTADSWKAVADALAEAKRVAADEAATQTQVDNAMNALSGAVGALVKADDEKPSGGEEKDYTPGTYNAPITMFVDAMNQTFLIDGHVVVAEDGTATLLIDFSRISTDGGATWVSAYETGTVYYLAFNGYSKDGTSSNLTTDGAQITWVDVTGEDGKQYHCLNTVEFPLPYLTANSEGIAEYMASLKFFVPAMSHLEFASGGFDYVVKLTVDLSDIPVKKTDDGNNGNNNSGNNNNNNNNGNGGGLVINGGSTTNKPGGTSGVTIKKNGTTTTVKTGDELNTLPWALALGLAALAVFALALNGYSSRKKEQK